MQMKKISRLLCMILVVTLMTSFAQPQSILATEDIVEWKSQTTNDPHKVWTIAFNHSLKASTIKNSTVFVEDEQYRLFFTDVKLSSDKKSIIVTPKSTYEDGKLYKLNIKGDIQSEKGKKLEQTIVVPFIVNGVIDNVNNNKDTPTTEAVISVEVKYSGLVTNIHVVSGDTITRITANGVDMHYEGANKYSLGLAGLKVNDNVRIMAYDSSGKRVFLKDYKVN